MANKFYIAGLATGANDGSSYANAWQTLQAMYDGLTGGNTCYMDSVTNGPETLSAVCANDTNAGTLTAPKIFKAVNGNQSVDPEDDVDGTLCEVDGNGAVAYVVQNTGARPFEYHYFLKYTGATSYGHYGSTTTSNDCVWIGCDYSGNTTAGWHGQQAWDDSLFFGCKSDTSTYGWQNPGDGVTHFLGSSIGGQRGWYEHQAVRVRHIMCIGHNKTGIGIYDADGDLTLFCTLDGCQDGLDSDSNPGAVILFSRFTNNSRYGINGSNATVVLHKGHNAFYNNTTSNDPLTSDGLQLGNNVSMAGHGYANLAGDDFTIGDSSEARRDATDIGSYVY